MHGWLLSVAAGDVREVVVKAAVGIEVSYWDWPVWQGKTNLSLMVEVKCVCGCCLWRQGLWERDGQTGSRCWSVIVSKVDLCGRARLNLSLMVEVKCVCGCCLWRQGLWERGGQTGSRCWSVIVSKVDLCGWARQTASFLLEVVMRVLLLTLSLCLWQQGPWAKPGPSSSRYCSAPSCGVLFDCRCWTLSLCLGLERDVVIR